MIERSIEGFRRSLDIFVSIAGPAPTLLLFPALHIPRRGGGGEKERGREREREEGRGRKRKEDGDTEMRRRAQYQALGITKKPHARRLDARLLAYIEPKKPS